MARPRSDIAPRIVHAARARFLHDGVDGASQRQIAREAGTSLGMIYYYFPTKDDLFLAVVEEVYAAMLADIAAALAPDVPVEARVRRLFARMGALTDDDLDVLRIIAREALVSNERRAKLIERFARGHLPLLVGLVAEGTAAGALRPLSPPLAGAIAMLALGLVPQVMRRLVGPELHRVLSLPSGTALAEVFAGVLFDGIRGEVGVAPPEPHAPSAPSRPRPPTPTPAPATGGRRRPSARRR